MLRQFAKGQILRTSAAERRDIPLEDRLQNELPELERHVDRRVARHVPNARDDAIRLVARAGPRVAAITLFRRVNRYCALVRIRHFYRHRHAPRAPKGMTTPQSTGA